MENFPDEFADSVLKYGVNSTAYTELSIDVLFVKDHEITLTGLSPDPTYYFVVDNTDQSGGGEVNNSRQAYEKVR